MSNLNVVGMCEVKAWPLDGKCQEVTYLGTPAYFEKQNGYRLWLNESQEALDDVIKLHWNLVILEIESENQLSAQEDVSSRQLPSDRDRLQRK